MHKLPNLNYEYDALEPYIDAKTMELHHSKHHQTYVDKLNGAIKGTQFEDVPVDKIIQQLDELPESIRTTVRNNGGGHYNHSLFWKMMSPSAKKSPNGILLSKIETTFGDLEKFKDKFSSAAVARFGSGWVWLTYENDELMISSSPNQDSVLMDRGVTPILCLDVWEHAYYLKYQNRRPEYIEAWWQVVDWQQVEENFAKQIDG